MVGKTPTPLFPLELGAALPPLGRRVDCLAFHDPPAVGRDLSLRRFRVIIADDHRLSPSGEAVMGVDETVEQGEASAAEGAGRRDLSEEDLSVRDGSEVAAGSIEDDDVEIAGIVRGEEGKVVVAT